MPRSARYLKWGLLLSLAGLLLLLAIHNWLSYPITRGFDARAHLEYLTFLRQELHLPLPAAGWELHQPPLYYVLMAWLPDAKLVQAMGVVAWFGLGIGAWWYLQQLSFSRWQAGWSSVWLLAVPVLIYAHPAISNEFFSGVVIMAFLACYSLKIGPLTQKVPNLAKPRPGWVFCSVWLS